ncbi:asparagine--tRNA ligase [Pontibacter sp. G13]|uniref:asparagine--tRNA ligase n=1 Tax=Pontibacter sp. G13 TaxID=3074898 RepID=UPI00288A6ECE|nr:asparagine--tRNA ligase [Pontibacter sp. G13]WNJ20529.1 asparagine--tRNA ligase [Pontibacter sp. G13]
MKRTEIKQLFLLEPQNQEVLVKGWVRTFRANRFIALNDGSTINNLQVVVDFEQLDESLLKRINTSAALSITGTLVPSQGKGQSVEVVATEVEVLGDADPAEYPIQPKKHSLEFLREKAHLRMRTSTFSAVFRIRHTMAYAIHHYFHTNGFFYMHSPIVTGSDAEGAGEMFRVSTLDPVNPPMTEDGNVDWKEDFFGKETNLTVSGQLEAEVGAMSLGKVYTFGPTFRAENSNTTRHLAEFWMIEPEVAFIDLEGNMDLAEDFLKFVISFIMEHNADDLAFLDNRIQQEEKNMKQADRRPMGLMETLKFVVENEFERITYTEAINILRNSKPYKKGKFEYDVEWGKDLQSEHERYLVEKKFLKPVIVTDYPRDIKAFYMKQNPDDKTVAAMDILFPGIGEVVGGSQREESLEKLMNRVHEMEIPEEDLWWYLELRKYGTAPHAGFGLGFERLMLFVTGMGNIRDVIPFPRAPKSADF